MAEFSKVSIAILLSTFSIFMEWKGTSAIPSCSLDVAFLVDSSGSVGRTNYQKQKNFVKAMAALLNIPTQSRGAVIIFDTTASISINMQDAHTLSSFKSMVQSMAYRQGFTRIDKALVLATKEIFPKARPNVTKIALVITDGKQNPIGMSLVKASEPLHRMGVRVIAVGIGRKVDKNELLRIVRNPNDVVLVSNFDSLTDKAQEISQYFCNISKPTTFPILTQREKPLRQTYNDINHLCVNSSNHFVRSFMQRINLLDHRDGQSLKNVSFILGDLVYVLKNQSKSITGSDVMCCIWNLDEFTFKFAEYFLNQSSKVIQLDTDNAVFHVQFVSSNASNDYVFPRSNLSRHGVMALLPRENFKKNDAIVVSILFKELHLYLRHMSFNLTQRSLATKILSLNVKPKANILQKNVTLRFQRQISTIPVDGNQPDCVFWEYAKISDEASGWSTKGCMVSNNQGGVVECKCNHLTNFAVLMQVNDEVISPNDQGILSIITYVGLGISLLGCLLTLILHFAFVNVKAKLSQIHLNLVVSIAMGQIIFISGINATENKIACACVAALIQYFYLVAFCWMLIEGVQLYLRIVKVFNIEKGMPVNYVFAWGFPLVVVIATIVAATAGKAGAEGFVHKKFCWLSFSNNLIWTFVGPVLAITLINVILLLHVIREMSKMDKAIVGTTPQLQLLRKTAKACAVLFPLLGVTWLFGVLTLSEVGVVSQYIFTILNSTQGFLIFLLNCVRNSEIRTKLTAKLRCLYHSKTMSSITPQENPTRPQAKKNVKTAFAACHPRLFKKNEKNRANKI